MAKENRGGKREGAGRKASGIEWKTVCFRIKEEWREAVKIVVRKEIARLKKGNPD
jgi:hypothetical protein